MYIFVSSMFVSNHLPTLLLLTILKTDLCTAGYHTSCPVGSLCDAATQALWPILLAVGVVLLGVVIAIP